MIDLQVPWRTCRFASLDLETTGTDVENDRIIEVGIVIFENGEVVDRFQRLVNPGVPIPKVVVEVTGIKDEDVAGAPTLDVIIDEIRSSIQGLPLLAYNHEFDLSILTSEFRRLGEVFEVPPCMDPLPFVWEYLRQPKITSDAKLVTAAAHFQVPLDAAHRADHDAEAAARVMFELPTVATLPDRLGDLLSVQRVLMQKVTDHFNRFRRNPNAASRANVLGQSEVVIELGAAYIYGEETDPIRALFQRIPDVRDRR
jgi:DNA polymerase III epsilon subunit family exonuclease